LRGSTDYRKAQRDRNRRKILKLDVLAEAGYMA
jgi:hypothetical protein